MLTGRILSPQRRPWVWLLVCLCIGQSLLPDMVLCMEADGRLMVEPAVGGKCRDLAPAPLAGKVFGAFVSTPRYCEFCLDLPLASGATYQLPRPVQTRVPLLAVPVMVVHPLLQPLAVESHRIGVLSPLCPAPSAARIALRSTILLI